jgi:hypothetical protein
MPTNRLFFIALLVLPLAGLRADDPLESTGPKFTKGNRVRIFVLTGQSNSLGTTADPDEKDITPGVDPLDQQIPFFWSNHSTRGSGVLYGNSEGKILTLRVQQGAGQDPLFWGPEFGFGRTLAAAGLTDFLIVKASRGGGGNSFWLKGHSDDHMYRHVVDTVRNAVEQLPKGTEFDIVGLLYLQGESDDAAEAEVAGERLQMLARNLREDLPKASKLRVIVGGIVIGGFRDVVHAQQSSLPKLDPSFRYLDNREWKHRRYDGLHYDKPAKLELGQRLAKEWMDWMNN